MVDDDVGILDIFKIVLERAGYEITIYNNGRQILDNAFKEPDIFILDRQLSGIDGLDVCRFLKHRAANAETPVIIFSASPHMQLQAKDAGADDFLEKPFKTKELLQMVEKHLNKHAA